MRVKLHNTTFNNVLWAKIENNTLIMSQKTPLEGIKEVRIPNIKVDDIQLIKTKNNR